MGQEPVRFTMPDGLPELMADLEQQWPVSLTALRLAGVPLNVGEDDPAPDPDPDPEPDPKPAQKPWGDDKDFDPEKAWKLIQNVRSDVDKFKTERDDLAKKVKTHEDASKSDTQKLEERATAAETRAAATEREAARLRIALEMGLTATQAKRLVGDTEEELKADADELLASFKNDDEGEGSSGSGGRRTPKPRMRTGAAASSEPEETDPDKLAEQVPRR